MSEVRILSTKKLKASQKQLLVDAGLLVVDLDFIRVTLLPFRLTEVAPNLIITSQNAVKSLAAHPEIQDIRRNPVFCVGQKTADLLDETGFTVQEVAPNAQELAEMIIADYSLENFTFFSGNIRRNELPMALLEADVDLNEIEVYETELTPEKVESKVDGILFFSPSAVQSYLKENTITDEVVFCIGQTTANEIVSIENPISIADEPTIESTITNCINHFKRR